MEKLKVDLSAEADDNFFGSLERSRKNLGELFGVEIEQDNENQTLKYQPIKQTQVDTATPGGSQVQSAWKTQLAKITNAYKNGEAVGKVGVAVLRNAEGACKLIIYRTKTNVLATCTFDLETHGSGQLRQQNRYVQFYDDENVYWSFYFDKLEDEKEFVEKLHECGLEITENVAAAKEKTVKDERVEDNVEDTATRRAPQNAVNIPAKQVLESKQHSKSSVISRVAKMGHPLPKLKSTHHSSNDYTDSSDADVITTPGASKPLIMPRSNKLQMKSQIMPVSNMGLCTAASLSNAVNGVGTNPIETQFMQMLLTENRTQNTEMRMNINKLETKIEKVLDKIDFVNMSNGATKSTRDDEILSLEEKILELKKENRRLKQTMEGCEQRNKKLLENILHLYTDDLVDLGLELKEKDNSLEDIMESLIRTAKALNNDISKSEVERADLCNKMKLMEMNLKELQVKHETALNDQLKSEEQQNLLQSQLDSREEKIRELQQELETQNRTAEEQSQRQRDERMQSIKTIMNSLYGTLALKIENVENLQKNAIIAIIGKTIREETLKCVDQNKK